MLRMMQLGRIINTYLIWFFLFIQIYAVVQLKAPSSNFYQLLIIILMNITFHVRYYDLLCAARLLENSNLLTFFIQ